MTGTFSSFVLRLQQSLGFGKRTEPRGYDPCGTRIVVDRPPHLCGTFSVRRRSLVCFWAALIACFHGDPLDAQIRSNRRDPESFIIQQRFVEEQLRRQFKEEVGDATRIRLDWGGWYGFHTFLFDDGVESSRTLRRHDLRLWSRLVLDQGAHEFYVRTRVSLLDFNRGDSFDRNHDDIEGPNLERGYYRFNLAKAVQNNQGRTLDYDLEVTLGRDLIQFGTGLVLSTPLDHVALRGIFRRLEFTGLAGRTVGSYQDFDLTRTAKRTRRYFFGGQLRYLGLERHQPFIYALWQRDRNDEARRTFLQGFDYDSLYLGIGSTGELAPHLRYVTEWVYQTGRSFGHHRFLQRTRIQAWAAHAQLEYLFPGQHRARASIEYLLGSGDGDRFASPTNTVGGHLRDSKDTGFIGFGYRDTGLSFAPRFSNLHMVRTGASFYPWPNDTRLAQLQLGTDWFFYHKHHRDGAVSDPTANRTSGYLGWEMDYFANWRITSDLAWTARAGLFFPGSAFDDRTARSFVLVGWTWSF